MINTFVVLFILLIHFVADFIFQTEWQAQNKSKNLKALITHTATYSSIFGLAVVALLPYPNCWMAFPFMLITFFFHTITDHVTSRISARLAVKAKEDGRWHNFFLNIGADQFSHAVQLLLTYYYLTK